MKKLINKVKSIRNKNSLDPKSRITTDTVAEHRAMVLAGGKKFKYPMQYARRRLVINAIAIGFAAIILATFIGWWRLYKQQDTGDFMYRITSMIPVPVAKVDDYPVLYSDYLMKYRSSIHYLEKKEQVDLSTDSGKSQMDYIKKQSMSDAVADACALKIAKEKGITVSDDEINDFINSQRVTSDGTISEQTYETVIMDYYGWSPSEYRHVTKNKLIRQKVAYELDSGALDAANQALDEITSDKSIDFSSLASALAKSSGIKVTYAKSGWLPKTNQDGGLSEAAYEMDKSSVSTSLIKSTDGKGYYLVRVLDKSDSEVSYEYINIPLSEFDNELDAILSDNKVKYYISVPE